MDQKLSYTREELEQILEEQKAMLQKSLAAMSPQERAEAIRKAEQAIKEDEIKRQRLLDSAAKLLAHSHHQKEKPKFCTHCGAKAGDGEYCEYCGKAY